MGCTVTIHDRLGHERLEPALEPLSIRDAFGLLESAVGETARVVGLSGCEVELTLCGDAEMERLNFDHMGERGPTDVLSFPLDDEAGEDGLRQLGDVVIAPGVAARNNPDDPAAELRLLLVHGILHLLGHDHMDDRERAEMWARQERYSGVRVR